jgi:hypothetical protein
MLKLVFESSQLVSGMTLKVKNANLALEFNVGAFAHYRGDFIRSAVCHSYQ